MLEGLKWLYISLCCFLPWFLPSSFLIHLLSLFPFVDFLSNVCLSLHFSFDFVTIRILFVPTGNMSKYSQYACYINWSFVICWYMTSLQSKKEIKEILNSKKKKKKVKLIINCWWWWNFSISENVKNKCTKQFHQTASDVYLFWGRLFSCIFTANKYTITTTSI